MNIYFILFFEFFKIALFTVGGGLAMISGIENTFVNKRKLLTAEDILNMVGLTQLVPGLIAVNSAVFVGHKLAGWRGSLAATIGVILPSIMIIILIAMFFPLLNLENPHVLRGFNCVRACVTGMFIILMLKLVKPVLKSKIETIIVACLTLMLLCGMNKVNIILIACFLGCFFTFISAKRMLKK